MVYKFSKLGGCGSKIMSAMPILVLTSLAPMSKFDSIQTDKTKLFFSIFQSHWESAEPVFCSEELIFLPYKNRNLIISFYCIRISFFASTQAKCIDYLLSTILEKISYATVSQIAHSIMHPP